MRNKRTDQTAQPSYVESSLGIITTGGHWFHTTRDQIEELAPEIFEHHSLEELVRAAETWIRSADSLSLLLYFVLVLVMPSVYAALSVLAFFVFLYTQKSALATPYMTRILRWINSDAFLIITAGVCLSWLGIAGRYLALVIGIFYYFLFKLGLLRWGLDRLLSRFRKGMTLNDRLFKMIIVKYSIYSGLEVPEIEDMDRRMRDLITRHQQKDH